MTGGKLLQDAMGKIDERYIAEVINTVPERAVGLRRSMLRYASLAACLCLLIGGIGVVWKQISVRTTEPCYATEFLPPVDLDRIVWGEPDAISASGNPSESVSDSLVMMHQDGWNLSGELYLAMEKAAPDTYLAILVSRRYDYNDMMRFSYKGKTRGEWEVEKEILSARRRKLGELSKEGLWLQYGEALYTTGTPDGERWTKELYEERVNFYGAYFLEQYIINGTLQSEKIEREMQATEARLSEITLIMLELEDAYAAQNAEEDCTLFAQKGVHYALKNGRLYLFLTAQELRDLRIRGKSKLFLSLANRRVFGSEEQLPSARVDESVSGFACEKISFYTDGVRYNTVSTDREVIEATKYLLERWQYTTDFLYVSIYADPRLSEDVLAAMGYRSVYFSTYSDLIMLNIPIDALNLGAIRDLSLLPQVSGIHISPPLIATN